MNSEIKTSESSPLRVDFVEGLPLGLTFAPGKQGPSTVGSYRWMRDLHTDVQRLKDHYGIGCVVTLVEEHELQMLNIANLRAEVQSQGMKSHWFPIPDGGVPDDPGELMPLLRTIRSAVRTGERVVVHCRGGLGRAGTVAACVLVSFGRDPADAIVAVRQARPRAIENEQQEDFVTDFSRFWDSISNVDVDD